MQQLSNPPDSSSDYASTQPPESAGPQKRQGNVLRTATLFVVFVCLALLALNGWLIYRAREHEIAQVSLANTNLARAVTQQVEGSTAEVEHILDGIVFELERADITPERLQRLQPVLVNQASGVEQLKGLFVFDAQGRWIVNSESTRDATLNNADREYFIYHRNNPSAGTHIGGPLVSRSSGEWVIPVSRRINDPDGKFDGVALATLSIKRLRGLLDTFDVGHDGAIALSLSNQLLVRKPFIETDLGRRLAPTALQALFASRRSGMAEARSALDGVWRIISFEHTRNYPILVTVAVGEDEALRDWRTTSLFQTALVLTLCAVVAAAGTYVIRSMRLRVEAEAGLRRARDALATANERLAHLAQYDGLTGLPNRRYFDKRLARAFRQAQRERRCLAVVMVDVDEFKKYNDLYGHVEGDHCLRRVAQALQSALKRPEDMVARYGGEEMVLLLPETGADGAALVAEAARSAVADLRIPYAATSIGHVSISLGVASRIPGQGESPSDLLKAADTALYQAKTHGRNQVRVYG
jgi:diguanylate cyclase (GGDEF)-like protein